MPRGPGGHAREGMVSRLPGVGAPVVRLGVTALAVVGVLVVVAPRVVDYDRVGALLASLPWWSLLVLVGLACCIEIARAAGPALMLPGLGLRRSLLADGAATAVANTVPGPSGAAMRYVAYRRLGMGAASVVRVTVVTGLLTTALVLAVPGVAVLLAATERGVSPRLALAAAVGVVVSVAVVALVVAVVTSERAARVTGRVAGRVVNRGLRLVNRAPRRLEDVAVQVHHDTAATIRRHWVRVSGVLLLRYVATFLVLLTAVRLLGGPEAARLSTVEVFAVYAVVRGVTVVELTPGGLGITEVPVGGALLWAAGGGDPSGIVAAVVCYRLVTWAGPVLLGAGCLLVLARNHPRRSAVGRPPPGVNRSARTA